MTHDEIAELLGAYALDAVDPDERDLVEEHLLSCARCRAEVAEHREVASLLAHSGADAPAGLWDRIAGSLEEAPPRLELAPVRPIEAAPSVVSAARRWRPTRAGIALTAAAAAVIALLGFQVREQDHRIDELQTALADPMTPAFEAAHADPDSQRFELVSDDGELVVLGAVTEDGDGFLRVKDLPDLGDNRTYQLWGAAGDQLVSLGVLGDHPSYYFFEGRGYSAFAITEEVAPGVVTSRQPPVVAGSVTA
jgi:hypothetical protein